MNRTLDSVRAFAKARSWHRYHHPRSLILAICSEAGELAHLFRWRRDGPAPVPRPLRSAAADEIADVLILLLLLCDRLKIDPTEAVHQKLAMNATKYPVHPK